jgi:hypothetical protein
MSIPAMGSGVEVATTSVGGMLAGMGDGDDDDNDNDDGDCAVVGSAVLVAHPTRLKARIKANATQ